MNQHDESGPAFPVQDASKWQAHGMTLRDYFAAQAMNGELSAMQDPWGVTSEADDPMLEEVARHWFRIADAMLRARSDG